MLKKRMSPESRARAEQKTELLRTALTLHELLRERGLTQEAIAQQLDRAQGNLSRTLRREDMKLSTLRELVEAMGGSLEISARFPDGNYRIDQLAQSGRRQA
jgi:transcriptional regulator